MVFGFEGGEEFVEFFFAFIGNNGVLRGESVGDGVIADGGASFGSSGAGALLGVAAIGFNLTAGDHESWMGCHPMVAGGGERERGILMPAARTWLGRKGKSSFESDVNVGRGPIVYWL